MAKHRTHSIEFKREVVQEFPTPSPSAIPKGDNCRTSPRRQNKCDEWKKKTEMEAGSANPLLKLAPIRSAIRPLLLGSGRWMERTLAWF
jgi:hypothetical protein